MNTPYGGSAPWNRQDLDLIFRHMALFTDVSAAELNQMAQVLWGQDMCDDESLNEFRLANAEALRARHSPT